MRNYKHIWVMTQPLRAWYYCSDTHDSIAPSPIVILSGAKNPHSPDGKPRRPCHSERGEESLIGRVRILRSAQNDNAGGSMKLASLCES